MRRSALILTELFVAAAVAGCAGTPPRPSSSGIPLPKDHLAKEDRQTWRNELRWPDTCEEATFDTAHIEFYPLAPKQTLIEVTCLQGAYQGTYRYYFYDESSTPPGVTVVKFPGAIEEVTGTPEFNAKTKLLAITLKDRGLGDCGTYSLYKVGEAGAVLQEAREKKSCDGKATSPKGWPPKK